MDSLKATPFLSPFFLTMFERIKYMIKKAKNLDEVNAFRFALTTQIRDKIIELNTVEQLYEEGEDALGNYLGDYTSYTVMLKELAGQRSDHITLKDSGDFYNSFRVYFNGKDIIIEADTVGDYDKPLTERFGNDLLGLHPENLQIVIDMIRPLIIKYVRRELGI